MFVVIIFKCKNRRKKEEMTKSVAGENNRVKLRHSVDILGDYKRTKKKKKKNSVLDASQITHNLAIMAYNERH